MKKYCIHNILKITSDLSNIFPDEFEAKFESKPDLAVKIGKFWNNKKEYKEIFPGIYSSYRQKRLFSSFSFFGKKMEYGILFDDETIELYIDKSYQFFSKHILRIPVSSLFPLEHLIKILLQIQLLRKGYTFFISAGIEKNGKVFLISSVGGMGKSVATTRLINENSGIKFLGDDTIITDGCNVFSYPKNIRIRKIGTPFLSVNSNVAPKKYFGDKYQLKEEGMPTSLFFIEHGDLNEMKAINNKEGIEKATAINDKVLMLKTERLIIASHYCGYINLNQLCNKQEELIVDLVEKLKVFVINADNKRVSFKLLNNFLK